MPTYAFSCPSEPSCGEWEQFVHSWRDPSPPCPDCKAMGAEKVWRVTRHVATSRFPFTTRNIRSDGKPVTVTSQSELDRLCKEHGVVQRDDAAWLTPSEELGYNIRTGKYERREGNGVGMPGCWV